MCGSESGGGSLVLRLPSESIYVSGGDAERKGTAGWMVLAEEEYFNMLSFVLVPTHKSINSMHTYVCIGLW